MISNQEDLANRILAVSEQLRTLQVSEYPRGVANTKSPPITDGNLADFSTSIGLASALPNTWIDTKIMPGDMWAVRSMIPGARDATREEVEPGAPDVGNFTAPASDSLVNSNGAAWFPKKKQFFWCMGGHGGYPGNEIYWMDAPTSQMGRLNDPSPMERWPEGPRTWSWRTTDGSCISNHTYNAIVGVEELDSFFIMFGSPWPEGGFPNSDIWKFHIPTKKWTKPMPGAMLPCKYPRGKEALWIPEYRKIAIGIPNFWRWYDPFNNTVGPLLGWQSTMSNGNSVATPEGIFVFGSNGSTHHMRYENIGIKPSISVNTTSHPRIRSHPKWLDIGHQWNSYFYDYKRKLVISWSASYTSEPTTNRLNVGKQVYGIDFANDELYEFKITQGTWSKSSALGSFTKWQHLTDIDCYIGLNNKAINNGWMVFKPGELTRLT